MLTFPSEVVLAAGQMDILRLGYPSIASNVLPFLALVTTYGFAISPYPSQTSYARIGRSHDYGPVTVSN